MAGLPTVHELENILENSGLEISEKPVKKRKKVSHACIPCRKAHVSCDNGRPCSRCIKRGHAEDCIDSFKGRKDFKTMVPIAPKYLKEDINFFQLFQNTSTLPMDDPEQIFNNLSLKQPEKLPNCFSQELEELFLPQINSGHVCQSRGLAGCHDCSFNVENMLPQPIRIEDTNSPGSVMMSSVSGSLQHTPLYSPDMQRSMSSTPMMDSFEKYYDSQLIPNVNSPIATADFHKVDHLNTILSEKGIEIPIASHIIYLARKLIENTKRIPSPLFSLKLFQEAMNNGFTSTPTCIFSPSGLVLDCNAPFKTLLSKQDLYQFCIYSMLDMGSTLCILDMAQKCESKETPGFGRCVFTLEQTNQKSCSLSLSTFSEKGVLWIVGQFIPI